MNNNFSKCFNAGDLIKSYYGDIGIIIKKEICNLSEYDDSTYDIFCIDGTIITLLDGEFNDFEKYS
jgi:hypothetical protein